MTLLVLFTAFLVEILWQKLPQFRQHKLIKDYSALVSDLVGKTIEPPFGLVAIILLPPLILSGLLISNQEGFFGLLLEFGFSVVVLS
ncbi:MAG: hypothetical protein V2I33_01020, partial [Kangiellaceae bacterium]|nr:hypothetical protein [Kangiellaceae bacterium]